MKQLCSLFNLLQPPTERLEKKNNKLQKCEVVLIKCCGKRQLNTRIIFTKNIRNMRRVN